MEHRFGKTCFLQGRCSLLQRLWLLVQFLYWLPLLTVQKFPYQFELELWHFPHQKYLLIPFQSLLLNLLLYTLEQTTETLSVTELSLLLSYLQSCLKALGHIVATLLLLGISVVQEGPCLCKDLHSLKIVDQSPWHLIILGQFLV